MRVHPGLVTVGIFAGSLVVHSAAHAASEAAEKLFKEGVALLQEKRYAEACPKLAEAERLEPGGGAALALAICREGEGKTASAFAEYQKALFFAKRDGRADREKAAMDKLRELEPLLPKVQVVVRPEARAQDVALTIDGVKVEGADGAAPTPIDPGPHVAVATAPGRERHEWTFRAEPSAVVELVVEPLAEKKSLVAPPPPPPPPASGNATRTVGLVLGGVGAASLIVGAYYGLKTLSLGSEVKARCAGGPCSDVGAIDDDARAHDYARISTWTMIGGGALLGAGAALYLLGGKDEGPRVDVGKGSVMLGWTGAW